MNSINNRLGKCSAGDAFFYVAFAVYLFRSILGRTEFDSFLGIPLASFQDYTQILIIILLILKVVFQRASISFWALFLALCVVGFVSWRQSDEAWFFWLTLFIVFGKGVSVKCLAAISLFETAAMVVLTVCCAQLGVIDNLVSVRSGVVRHAMGFGHPNYFGLYLLSICLAFSVLRFGKNPLPDILLLICTVVVNLTWADSRSTALLSVVQIALLLVFYNVRNRKMQTVLSRAFFLMVLLIVAASLFLMFNYDSSSSMQSTLNQLLTGRLRLAHEYYSMGSLTLLGNSFDGYPPIYWENGQPVAFVVDNAYCHLILRYGLVPFALFVAGFFLMFLSVLKEKRWDYLLFGLVIMGIYGFAETLGIKVESNYFLIAMTTVIFGTKQLSDSPPLKTSSSRSQNENSN